MQKSLSLKQRKQLADYNQDETKRVEKTQYDPRMRYLETVDPEGEQSFDDITSPKHYCAGFEIEPLDFILKNQLDFLEGNIVKYISRYDQKGGVKDLKKAKFYLDKLIEREVSKNER